MAEEGGELNLVPYLDIVTNVIMFMLATTTFAAALGNINVSSPSTSAAANVAQAEPDQQPKDELNLTVTVTEKGFTIAASGAVLYQGFSFDANGGLQMPGTELPTIPKKKGGDKGEEYDYELLSKKMSEIKGSPQAAAESKVIINANPAITYDIVVAVMDACRNGPDGKILFPDVLLAAGLN
jgi:biopolymer transport protein ExbD